MGLSLNMGLNGQGAFGSGYGTAATPAAAGASAQGPTTIGGKAFGVTTGGGGMAGMSAGTIGLLSLGSLSLIGLIWIWYTLPR